MSITANRYHDISCGHRVVGHENKCAHLHGHNYRFHFFVEPDVRLDRLGRVVDFSVIKHVLCEWLEKEWDHKFLVWIKDPMRDELCRIDPYGIALVPFNPTAENMAMYVVDVISRKLFEDADVTLVKVTIEETRKCSVTYQLKN